MLLRVGHRSACDFVSSFGRRGASSPAAGVNPLYRMLSGLTIRSMPSVFARRVCHIFGAGAPIELRECEVTLMAKLHLDLGWA